ncbi:trypsin-like peptidase domain-containing protein [Streptomyces cacaoi]|uniref:VMAP-C domain-containing protein n=1 Tax=Streptomyces cacaoi TaxID=1898 RepID=UPI0011F30EF9|nr:trypsin-like peptidase domain-containing protein [Streptomyces cacaoi]
MGWFRSVGDPSPSADPRQCVLSVRRRDGRSAGGAVLLGPEWAITCAHVVNDALGRELFAAEPPGEAAVTVVGADPAGGEGLRHQAVTACWIPARRPDGSPVPGGGVETGEWLGDLALLRLTGLPGAAAAPQWLEMAQGQTLRSWHGSGLARSYADVRVGACDGRIGYLDGAPTGMAIGPGYSGGPLWSGGAHAVVGLVVAQFAPPVDPATGAAVPHSPQHVVRRAWGVPWQRIREELREAGAWELVATRACDPDDPALPLLTGLLEQLAAGERLRTLGREVADRCGLGHRTDGSAPTAREFAELLVTHPRALAALSGLLRRDEPHTAAMLLACGRFSEVPRLLSPSEERALHTLLKELPPEVTGRLDEVVRAALPRAAALPSALDGRGARRLWDHLEQLPGDSRAQSEDRRVPALLRAVEFVAVLCPEGSGQRARLRLWVDGVAERLATPRSALAERRAEAEEWARTAAARTGPPRVLVQVSRAGERYRLRVWCDEGSGPRQVPTGRAASCSPYGGSRPGAAASAEPRGEPVGARQDPVRGAAEQPEETYTAAEAARALLDVLESLHRSAPGEERPLVETLVDSASLNLPVDEWESQDSGDLVPGVLGAEYQLVVHCPELLRRHERFVPDWRRRWRQLDSGDAVRITDESAGGREVYALLLDRRDAVRVTVDVPDRARDEIVKVCLSMGIPVVVWDRSTGRQSHAVRHMTEVTTRALPEGVRSYRAKTLLRPGEFPGRPVLAWADADRTVPRLMLSEP